MIRHTTTEMQLVNIDRLVPYQNNARTHSPEQINKLRASLREFGFINPVIIDRDFGVIAGHGRIAAARAEGITEVPCVFADFFGTGDDDAKDDDFDLSSALEQASFVQKGDVWTVGRHRLMCGDATSMDDVATLMDGKKANLLLTDPPYGVSFKSSSGLTIQNDSMKNEEFYQFLYDAFAAAVCFLGAGASAYVFHADTEGLNFRKAFIDAGFHLAGCCIWVKDSLVLGRSDYQWQHEPVLYGFLQNGKHNWYSDRKQTTVWNFAKPKRNANHPTSKPLDLLSYPIGNSTQENGIVLDSFGGSGSTMMACEQTNRICYMMELDEKYASVILRRSVEDGISPDDIFVERDGVRYGYADLVKEVEHVDA